MTCIFASVLYSIRFEIFSIFAGYLSRIFFFFFCICTGHSFIIMEAYPCHIYL